MKINKKVTIAIIAVTSLGMSIIAFQATEGNNERMFAGETNYSLNFSSSVNKLSAVTTETTMTAQTSLGNPINFAYNNIGTRLGYWGRLNEGGYFYNTTALSGLESIEITFADTNGVKISYGWSSSLYRVNDVALAATEAGGTASYAFGSEAPSFFKIAYDSAVCSIKTITLTYSCSLADDPYSPGTDGLALTLSPDSQFYSVTGYTGTAEEVVINSSYLHLPVKEIGSFCFSQKEITKVSIPSSVVSIDYGAFEGCSSLVAVSIPSSVTSIGLSAFQGCSSLSSVSIPSSVTSIGESAFASDTKLFSIEIDKDNAYFETDGKIIYNKGKTSLLYYPTASGNYQIPSYIGLVGKTAFQGCSSLASVSIPSSVTSIGSGAFQGCSSLSSVSIPSSVTSIGSSAFKGCSSLSSVSIPSSVTSIEALTFSNCTSLSSLSIPASVTSIGSSAFEGCSSLVAVSIPSSVTSIGALTFLGCTSLAAVSIPASVASIENGTFMNCSALASVSIPASVTSIGAWAFSGCSSLAAVSIPSPVTSIGESAFSGCTSLAAVSIPSSVTSIGSRAFKGCSSLGAVSIPSSVTSIGESAFSGCTSLAAVSIPSSVTSIGAWAFSGCSKLSLTCQAAAKPSNWDDYWNLDNCPVKWKASYRSTEKSGDFGISVAWDMSKVLTYAGSSASVDVPTTILGTDITEIPGTFLSRNKTATYLRIPDTVTTVDANAVSGCTSLKTIILGSGVTSIGSGAFSGCTALEACYFKGTPEQWAALNFTTFGDSVAYYSEADKSGATDHSYWHYDTDGVTPVIWNA